MASPLIDRLEALGKRLGEKRWVQEWPYYGPILLIGFGALLLYLAAPEMEPPESSVKSIPTGGGAGGERHEGGYVSLAEQEFEARRRMILEGVPGGPEEPGARTPPGTGGSKAAPGRAAQPGADRRARELRYLAEHRQEMDLAVTKFDGVKRRFFKESPKVREINAYFGRKNMPRFMALYDKYHRTDEFELWRQAFLLPEFREGVRRYATDPETLKTVMRLLADYSSQKPPLSAVREGLFFAGTDEQASGFLREHVWPKVMPSLPSALKVSGFPEDEARKTGGLAGVISGGAGFGGEPVREVSVRAGVAPMDWQAKNTWKLDDNMKGAILHGIDFYLFGETGAKATAETEKTEYHERLQQR